MPRAKTHRPTVARHVATEKGHGRIETRITEVIADIPDRLYSLWPDLRQILRLERRREHKSFCERQIVYAITSIPPERMGPAELGALARAHWAIENRLFHVRDVTFKEDACRVRSGAAPITLAHMRDKALAIIRSRGLKPRPAREAFAANPKAAIREILRA